MLIWPTAHRVGRSEQEVAEALKAVPTGIALVGVRLPGVRGREIDVLVIEPRGVTTIEAKGTSLRGPVQASPNGDWLIGGQPAGFAGPSANPVGQAAAQAHRLRELCEDQGFAVGFVPAVVVVCGDVTCQPAVVSGGVWASDLANLPYALDRLRRGRPLTRPVVRSILRALGLGTRMPDDAALDAAGFPRDDGSLPGAATAAGWSAQPAPGAYAPPPHRPPPQPSYAYYAPQPPRRRRRRQPRGGPPYGRANPMEQWPARRAPRDNRPQQRRRRPARHRSPLWLFVRTVMLVLVLVLVVLSMTTDRGDTAQDPAPRRQAPTVRETPPR